MSDIYKNLIHEDLTSFIKSIDKLRNIIRYQTAPRNKSESVAEHSFFVASYILKLYEYYEFDLQKALILALLHDYSEVYISDVPHPIKAQNPELNKALEEAEEKVNRQKLSDSVADWIQEFNNKSSPEGKICALADILSVVTYSKYETDLGNKDYMAQVYESVKKRYINCIDMLKPNLRKEIESQQVIIDYIEKIFFSKVENS